MGRSFWGGNKSPQPPPLPPEPLKIPEGVVSTEHPYRAPTYVKTVTVRDKVLQAMDAAQKREDARFKRMKDKAAELAPGVYAAIEALILRTAENKKGSGRVSLSEMLENPEEVDIGHLFNLLRERLSAECMILCWEDSRRNIVSWTIRPPE